ncbi:MAG: phosphoglucomutase/phosphomannomutase family protein [Candidatus Omnitrophota bacterium]
MDIKFGTSGWRGIISDDFTFDNVRLVAQAIADYVNALNGRKKEVIVGYDTRFLSKEFARACSSVLLGSGIMPLLTDRDTPTPVISFHILDKKASGAINITASHNPSAYNGIKFSPSSGSPAGKEITSFLEKRIETLRKKKWHFKDEGLKGVYEEFDPQPRYLAHLKKLLNADLIRKSKARVGIDFLYGTSRGYLDVILKSLGVKLCKLHEGINPSFGGIAPTPAGKQLAELSRLVKSEKLDIGLATDPDGDRFGIIDRDGTFITANEVICVVLEYLITTRKKYATVARTLATTSMVDKIATAHNMRTVETPVGFKYIAEELISGDCLMGAEESGGLSIAGHVPEKDGILACLLVLEACLMKKKSVKGILKDITKTYGTIYSDRMDVSVGSREKLLSRLKTFSPTHMAGLKVAGVHTLDGFKFNFTDSSWLLIRPSGTEPMVRLYAESSCKKALTLLLNEAKRVINF